MKKLAKLMALVLVVGLILMACSSPVPGTQGTANNNEGGGLTIGATFMDMSNPYFVQFAAGFEAQAAAEGHTAIVVDGAGDASRQVTAIENFIAQGVDAIVVGPIDPNAVVDVVARAREAGIAVLSVNQPTDGAQGFFLSDEYNFGFYAGMLGAEWINQKLDGVAEVALIIDPTMEAMVDRGQGAEDAIRQLAPGAEIVAIQGGSLTGTIAAANAEAILLANPNVNVIVTINDTAALAVVEVVRTLGLASDLFYVGGLDATAEAIASMQEEGSIFRASVDIAPYASGREIIRLVEQIIADGEMNPQTVFFDMIPVTQVGFDVPGGVSVADR